jgi:hypothetical protein
MVSDLEVASAAACCELRRERCAQFEERLKGRFVTVDSTRYVLDAFELFRGDRLRNAWRCLAGFAGYM